MNNKNRFITLFLAIFLLSFCLISCGTQFSKQDGIITLSLSRSALSAVMSEAEDEKNSNNEITIYIALYSDDGKVFGESSESHTVQEWQTFSSKTVSFDDVLAGSTVYAEAKVWTPYCIIFKGVSDKTKVKKKGITQLSITLERVEEPIDEPIDDPEKPIDEPIDKPEEPIDDPEKPIDKPEEPIDDPEKPIDKPEEPIPENDPQIEIPVTVVLEKPAAYASLNKIYASVYYLPAGSDYIVKLQDFAAQAKSIEGNRKYIENADEFEAITANSDVFKGFEASNTSDSTMTITGRFHTTPKKKEFYIFATVDYKNDDDTSTPISCVCLSAGPITLDTSGMTIILNSYELNPNAFGSGTLSGSNGVVTIKIEHPDKMFLSDSSILLTATKQNGFAVTEDEATWGAKLLYGGKDINDYGSFYSLDSQTVNITRALEQGGIYQLYVTCTVDGVISSQTFDIPFENMICFETSVESICNEEAGAPSVTDLQVYMKITGDADSDETLPFVKDFISGIKTPVNTLELNGKWIFNDIEVSDYDVWFSCSDSLFFNDITNESVIGEYQFAKFDYFTEVDLNGVKTIKNNAFRGLNKSRNSSYCTVRIRSSVKAIAKDAFDDSHCTFIFDDEEGWYATEDEDAWVNAVENGLPDDWSSFDKITDVNSIGTSLLGNGTLYFYKN